MARSAVEAGLRVSSIDAFGDLDHPQPAYALTSRPGAGAGWRTSRVPGFASSVVPAADAVAYGSGLENDPRAVAALARGRVLWGNPPEVLRRVRDPWLLRDALRARGHQAPDVLHPGDARPAAPRETWLVKPLRSGGGRGVRSWRRGTHVPSSCYAQRYIEGAPGSVLFVAARGRVAPLGVTQQLVGDPAFGSGGFRYCGSLLSAAGDPGAVAWHAPAMAVAGAVASAFDLVGVNGVDFMARDGVVHPIEVNPRWTSSMELVERAWGRSLFAAHVLACVEGQLPRVDGGGFVVRPARIHGKAIVFARRDVHLGDTRAWLGTDVADVPRPWTQISAGQPVCTVFAEGVDAAGCHAALAEGAARIYQQLEVWAEEAA